MKCPHCGVADNSVVDSRVTRDGHAIRRRRQCNRCERRFTTYERVEGTAPLVVKKDGSREAFSRAKILEGLRRACEKRTVTLEQLERLVDDLERDLIEFGEREVESSVIGEHVLARLRDLDEVAYVRFASVYRSFGDVEQFMRELSAILRDREGPQGAVGGGNGVS
jgi:transcriptional repressor NrdR